MKDEFAAKFIFNFIFEFTVCKASLRFLQFCVKELISALLCLVSIGGRDIIKSVYRFE